MATKKIQIEFDLNTNEVKLAGEATMSLAQQVRVLQKELSKTPEGTKEFELLRRKLNDTKDNFDRVNAKSRELFGTLSLIPGPIGEVAGKLNGAISLMKTFSGFSFKDLSNQFTGLIDDIKGIFASLGGLSDVSKNVSQAQEQLSDTTRESANNASLLSSQAIDAGASIQGMEQSTKAATAAQRTLVTTQLGVVSATDKTRLSTQLLTQAELAQIPATESNAIAYATKNGIVTRATLIERAQTIATQENTVAQGQNVAAQEGAAAGAAANAAANEALAAAETKAAVAGRVLRGVLTSLGIGAIIVLVGLVVGKFMELVDAMKASEDQTDALNRQLERQKQLLDDLTAGIDAQTQIDIERAKQAGKTEAEIFEIRKKGLQAQLQATRQTNNDLRAEEFAARKEIGRFAEMSEEDRLEFIQNSAKQRTELTEKEIQLTRQIELEGEKEKTRIAEDGRKKRTKDTDKDNTERINKLKAQLDAQIQLEIDSENTRLDVLEGLLEQRFKLEQGSASELELLYKENQKKVRDAIKDDSEKRRQDRLKNIQAEVEIEESQAKINSERLIELLSKRRDIELQEEGLTATQKLAIQEKYEADFRQLRQKAREEQLVNDINANIGNFETQIQLYRQFSQEVINSENYTAAEKLRIQQETNDKIQQLESERFDNEVTQLQNQFGATYAYNEEYYNSLNALYDAEEARYKRLYESKEITEAEYTAFLKQNRDARIAIGKQELEAKLADLQALASALEAGAALAGEQTRLGKTLAVASSTINTYTAANQVLADPTLPTVIKVFTAAGIILRGLANVRRILQVQVPTTGGGSSAQFSGGVINVNQRRAQGGFITGPGGDTSDDIPAMLSNGEFVINSRSTRVFRPLLETINSASNLPAFAAGGLVRESGGSSPFKSQNETIADAITTAFGQTPIKTYVTATDVSTQQQFERVIKSRSLI